MAFYNWVETQDIDWNVEFTDSKTLITDLAWEHNNDTSFCTSVEYIYEKLYDYIYDVPRLRKDFHLE